MQQIDIFATVTDPPSPEKAKEEKPVSKNVVEQVTERKLEKKAGNVMTNPMGTEMVVNDQIKVKMKQLKRPEEEKRTAANDSAALIDRIKAKLKKEFDLTTPVERNDDDYQKGGKPKTGEHGIESFSAPMKIPPDEELFQKQYYTMGAVSEMFHINQSMLRHWENEFDILKPKKNKKGDRYFRPIDIKNIELIYYLIRSRKFTIEGAKSFINQHKEKAADTFAAIQSLKKLRSFLTELKANL
ncbi:MAG: MerR family transcriptional regulator [Chitinophagaceae bacterium]